MPRAVIVSPSERGARFRPGQRLHRPAEFSAVMAARKVVRGDSFDLHFCPVETANAPRIGLIVPKRLARAAVQRNAIKRQAREAFRLAAPRLAPCDLVLRLKRPMSAAGTGDGVQSKAWRTEMEKLLRHLLT